MTDKQIRESIQNPDAFLIITKKGKNVEIVMQGNAFDIANSLLSAEKLMLIEDGDPAAPLRLFKAFVKQQFADKLFETYHEN